MKYAPFVFAGDWHGDANWVEYIVPMIASAGHERIYQLGDFGIWKDEIGTRYLDRVNKVAIDSKVKIFVIPGNHECYDLINSMKTNAEGWLVLPEYKNILFAPRGHIWSDSSYSFAALGGAGTIDLQMRTLGENWWSGEEITQEDRDNTIDNIRSLGIDRIDFLLTHEAPIEAEIKSIYPKLRDLSAEVEEYCLKQRYLLSDVINATNPRINVHGHWHQSTEFNIEFRGGKPTLVKGLSHEGSVKNLWIPTFEEINRIIACQ